MFKNLQSSFLKSWIRRGSIRIQDGWWKISPKVSFFAAHQSSTALRAQQQKYNSSAIYHSASLSLSCVHFFLPPPFSPPFMLHWTVFLQASLSVVTYSGRHCSPPSHPHYKSEYSITFLNIASSCLSVLSLFVMFVMFFFVVLHVFHGLLLRPLLWVKIHLFVTTPW